MFKNFFQRLASAFRGGFNNIFNVIMPIVQSRAGKLIDEALPIAIGIVTDMAKNQSLPSADKRNAAVSQLQTALVDQGVAAASDISASVLNLVLELAVSHLKATSPAR